MWKWYIKLSKEWKLWRCVIVIITWLKLRIEFLMKTIQKEMNVIKLMDNFVGTGLISNLRVEVIHLHNEVEVLGHLQMNNREWIRRLDFDCRIQIFEIFSEQFILNPNLLFNICSSDECTLMMNSVVNRHNSPYLSDIYPLFFIENHTQVS